ncbi:NADAR domain-containing protein [Aphelenchoides besseyi]|nr:NADAR domain-containing protein [Aphelenchoides besseyi]
MGTTQSKVKQPPLFIEPCNWTDSVVQSGKPTMTVDNVRSMDGSTETLNQSSISSENPRKSSRFTIRAVLKTPVDNNQNSLEFKVDNQSPSLPSPSAFSSSRWTATSSEDWSPSSDLQSPPASIRSMRTSASSSSQFSYTRTSTVDLPPLYVNSLGEFYVVFYGPHYVYSNSYESEIACNGNLFPSSRHYFLYQKALFHNNKTLADRIANEPDVDEVVKLFANFKASNHGWNKVEVNFMRQACMAKFEQNPLLRTELFRTGNATLVCASPDSRWGVNLEMSDPNCANPANWRGQNLHGQILMAVRAALAAQYASEFIEEQTIAERRQKRAIPCI